ncbi:glycoside hydrolase family 3 [Candidatus Bipolaricaulota bacterium]|nr:glycoside hydrolase family 3 [Candidatus Bipolaricaulota bacterium]
MKEYTEIPLFVAIDQEGGKVARLKEKFGFPETVSQGYLGEEDNPRLTRFYASRTAGTLAGLGINVNLAPVLDLNVNPESPAIGALDRSFSADPEVVIRNAEIVIEELNKRGIMSCLKHFPGHGSSAGDSHEGITDVSGTWREVELEPYREIVRDGYADSIMTAHIFNYNWDTEYPATLSEEVITGMLREDIGFDGLVFSDDMNMGAIRKEYSLEETIERAINAGADVLIFANNLTYDEMIAVKAVDIVKKLIEEGRITESRIDRSYERIIDAKERLENDSCQGDGG